MPLTLQSYCPVRLLFEALFHVVIHLICLPFVGMVTTRSAQANYILVPTSNSRPVRSNCTPNSKYFAQLHGRVNSKQTKYKRCPLNWMAFFSHWFLSYIGPKKKPGVEVTFEDVFFQSVRAFIPVIFFPSYPKLVSGKARRLSSSRNSRRLSITKVMD